MYILIHKQYIYIVLFQEISFVTPHTYQLPETLEITGHEKDRHFPIPRHRRHELEECIPIRLTEHLHRLGLIDYEDSGSIYIELCYLALRPVFLISMAMIFIDLHHFHINNN